jgi:hypothetical protein
MSIPFSLRSLIPAVLGAAQLLACTNGEDATLGAHDGAVPADAEGDAHEPPASPIEDYLRQSEAAWQQLERQNGGSYWYELEDCVVNSMVGRLHLVQVENGRARTVGSREIPASACRTVVNSLGPSIGTFPELYESCRAMSRRAMPLSVALGAPPSHCYRSTSPQCFDACGEGFALRSFGWGGAPNWSDQTGPGCLSTTVRWGSYSPSVQQGVTDGSELRQALRPCRRYELTGFDGGVCTQPLVSDAGVDVGDIAAALAHGDVVEALARDGGVLGYGLWNGARVTRIAIELDGGRRHIDIGDACDAGPGTGCTPVAPGVVQLQQLLDTLDKQQRPLSDCAGARVR